MTVQLTKKQEEILILIPRFRFLDRTHIQSFLNHKDKQRINKWLKDLTTKQYLRRIYDDTIIGKNRRPAIFSLDTSGVRFVRSQGIYETSFLRTLYYEKNRSESFIEHSLLLATICADLERRTTDTITYAYTTESDLYSKEHPYSFLKKADITVDLIFEKKEKRKKMKQYILTVFDDTLPKYRIRNRLRKCRDFYFSNEWENNIDMPFPTLLFIGATKEIMIYAKRYARTLFSEEGEHDLTIHFATVADVKEYGITGQIWEKV